jgi:hypothetical protein
MTAKLFGVADDYLASLGLLFSYRALQGLSSAYLGYTYVF